jgi:hypothetical protein
VGLHAPGRGESCTVGWASNPAAGSTSTHVSTNITYDPSINRRRHGLLAAAVAANPNNLFVMWKDKGPHPRKSFPDRGRGGNPPPSMVPAHGIHSHVIILVLTTPLPSLAVHVFGDAHRVLGLHI